MLNKRKNRKLFQNEYESAAVVYTIHAHMISGGIDMTERQRGNVFQADAHMDNASCLWISDSTERALARRVSVYCALQLDIVVGREVMS